MSPDRRPLTETDRQRRIAPMLPRETKIPPLTRGWIVEIKWDGICAMASSDLGAQKPQVTNKNGRDISHAFPEINAGLVELARRHSFTLHGEIISGNGRTSQERSVAIGRAARSAFSVRQGAEQYPCHFMAFDLLEVDGQDLTLLPLQTRKAGLRRLISKTFQARSPISVTTALNASDLEKAQDNPELLGELSQHEGLVFKRLDSLYRPGLSSAWLKFKFNTPKAGSTPAS